MLRSPEHFHPNLNIFQLEFWGPVGPPTSSWAGFGPFRPFRPADDGGGDDDAPGCEKQKRGE